MQRRVTKEFNNVVDTFEYEDKYFSEFISLDGSNDETNNEKYP